jgi:SAM-dependent methyltransferase
MGGVHLRAKSFGPGAADYERGRPGWPPEAIDALERRLGLHRGSAVLDLAAGTGKLTRLLTPRFETVVAVEPLDGMRAVLEQVVPGAHALAGTAEAIPLDDASVDAVVVAEAFHWFDVERAVAEIARVLRPGGGVGVLYNRRVYEADWERDCHPVFEAHRMPPDDVDPFDATAWTAALASRFGEPREDTFDHTLRLDADGVLALYSSFSVIAGLPPARREAALTAFAEVLDRHHVRTAELHYRAILTTARPGPRETDPVGV